MATAGAAAPEPYVRPRLLAADSVEPTRLVGVRHPCVEVQDGVSYIPNDVEFQKGKWITQDSCDNVLRTEIRLQR